ncbi:MAG: Gfo/Idh/MocA family oxidoreductase [Bacteroidota bacterium]
MNRRQFVISGLLGTGGILYTCGNTSTSWSQRDSLRVGIIGTGNRGKGLQRFIKEIEGIEVVALADILPFRLEEAKVIDPGAKTYNDYRKLLDDKQVDAVIISTPFFNHHEIAIDALDANMHVYCEKTMVKGISNLQPVINKSNQKKDLVFQTGHQYHSSPLYKKVRDIIRSGYIGEVTAYHCQWNRRTDWRKPVPDSKFERMINWRMYREYSGGLIAELMSHQIDYINWVTESRPSRMSGFGGIDHYKDGRETFDNVHLLMEYPSGLDATFTCTTTNSQNGYEIRILGSKATIVLKMTMAEIFIEKPKNNSELGMVDGVSGATREAWEKGEGVPIEAPGNNPTIDALKQFRDSVLQGKKVYSDIETGANTSKCIQIALDALHEDKISYWDDYPELIFT